jgi:hypothetical protein
MFKNGIPVFCVEIPAERMKQLHHPRDALKALLASDSGGGPSLALKCERHANKVVALIVTPESSSKDRVIVESK